MKLTNQRKGVAIVLGLGVLALGIDRFVLRADESGPAAASASPVDLDTPQSSGNAVAQSPIQPASQGPTLSDRLERHRHSSGDIGDAFAVPASWIPPAKIETPIAIKVETNDPLDELVAKMKLTAVAPSRQGVASTALINGRTLVQGAAGNVDIGNESYAIELISTNGHESAVIRFVSSGREVTLKRAAHSSPENHGRSSR